MRPSTAFPWMQEFRRFDVPYPAVYGVSPATVGPGKRVGIIAVKRYPTFHWQLCRYTERNVYITATAEEAAWLESLPITPGTVEQFARPPELNN